MEVGSFCGSPTGCKLEFHISPTLHKANLHHSGSQRQAPLLRGKSPSGVFAPLRSLAYPAIGSTRIGRPFGIVDSMKFGIQATCCPANHPSLIANDHPHVAGSEVRTEKGLVHTMHRVWVRVACDAGSFRMRQNGLLSNHHFQHGCRASCPGSIPAARLGSACRGGRRGCYSSRPSFSSASGSPRGLGRKGK